jgi:hypothetical protein
MAVTTHNSRSRKSKSLLWPDYVHNTLSLIIKSEVCEAKVFDVLLEGKALGSGIGFVDKCFDILKVFSGRGWDVLQNILVWVPVSRSK